MSVFQKQSSSSSQATVIARGVTLEGNFQGQGDVIVEGCVKGSVATGGSLTVGAEAVVEAEVRAAEAHVAGTIQGNVVIANRLELRSTAKIVGDVTAQIISIEAGACLQGRLSVGVKAVETKHASAVERAVMRAAA